MGKRQPISFDNGELVGNLKTSTGDGLDALFSGTSQPEPEAPKKELVKVIKKKTKKAEAAKEKKEIKQTSNITNNIASNITILQLGLKMKQQDKKHNDNFNYEMTSEADSLNVVFNSLDENTAYSLVIQVLLKNHQYYPNNDEELDSLMDKLSSTVGTSEWTKSKPQISNKKLADGTEYKEYIYYVTDKQQGEFKWILSPIYKFDRLYIFIGFSHETYYKDFDSAYYESLSTLNFTE